MLGGKWGNTGPSKEANGEELVDDWFDIFECSLDSNIFTF